MEPKLEVHEYKDTVARDIYCGQCPHEFSVIYLKPEVTTRYRCDCPVCGHKQGFTHRTNRKGAEMPVVEL